MISKDTILSEVFDWEKILDGGLVTGTKVQGHEETLIQQELTKTVDEFIKTFKRLLLEVCKFDHERFDRFRYFVECPFFGRNVGCGHPRVLRAKFKIARRLLYLRGQIDINKYEDYRDQVYEYTEPLTGGDVRATFGYREEFRNGGIRPDSPTGQKMASVQEEFGTKLLSLRDEIVGKLEAVFLH